MEVSAIGPSTDEVELLWEQLIEYLRTGALVPVVGQDLLRLSVDGREVPLYTWLAQRLAAKLKIDVEGLPDTGALDAVVYRYLAGRNHSKDLTPLYSNLNSVMPRPGELPVPAPLDQLARIETLQLFVTTTFDSMLVRALNEARFGGDTVTQILSHRPGAADTIELGTAEAPVVLHFFGSISPLAGQYALTEEDKLEFVHNLQSERWQPRLVDELSKRPLLVLGQGFPDWLARFFLRVSSGSRLSASQTKTVFVDPMARTEPQLARFLKTFGSAIQVVQDDAAAFVAELYRRWQAAKPVQTLQATKPRAGAIFLCYAREDHAAASTLHQALRAEALDVWFDERALRAGDHFDLEIQRAIQSCCLFVPLISRHSLTKEGRYFRTEWKQAEHWTIRLPSNYAFILPVAIDDTPEYDPALPEAIRSVQWKRLPGGKADPAFVAEVKQRHRQYQLDRT